MVNGQIRIEEFKDWKIEEELKNLKIEELRFFFHYSIFPIFNFSIFQFYVTFNGQYSMVNGYWLTVIGYWLTVIASGAQTITEQYHELLIRKEKN